MAMQETKPRGLAAPRNDEMMPGGMNAKPGQSMTRAETSGGHFTAIQVAVKREAPLVKREVLFEAGEMGKEFFYAWEVKDKTSPTGKSLIKGMSIEGAMVIARNWGNCFTDVLIEEESPREWVFKAVFVDHQTGFTLTRLFRQRKAESHGNFDAERALDIAFQIGQSKAIRNVIANAMPSWLIDQAMEVATRASEKAFTDLPAALAQAQKFFGKLGVTDEQLVRKIGKPFDQWVARDHAVLSSIYKAIKEGMTTVAAEFSDAPAVQDADDEEGDQQGSTGPESPRTGYGADDAGQAQQAQARQATVTAAAPTPAKPAAAPAPREAGDDSPADPYAVPGVPPVPPAVGKPPAAPKKDRA